MISFHPPPSGTANRHADSFASETANIFLDGEQGSRPPFEIAAEIFKNAVGDIKSNPDLKDRDAFAQSLRAEIQGLPAFGVFAKDHRPTSYHNELYRQVMQPLAQVLQRGISPPPRNQFNNRAALISFAMKQAGKLPHELDRGDIIRAAQYEGNSLANTISQVFAYYKFAQYSWVHEQFEKVEFPNYSDLLDQYRDEYPPPWDALRKILSEMRLASGDDGLFDFEFSDPSEYPLRVDNFEQFSFTAKMTNRTTGARYKLDSLSSGEKVLMALCLISFNQHLGRRRPKLLLLDELDALLHPSMAAALVTALKSSFIRFGTKVLLTSHSPMTVATLDEAAIFRVTRDGRGVRVSSATKLDAINELSEGIATVDAGLRIAAYDEAKVTILTEGNNACHLKKWVELKFPRGVHVFDQLPRHTSDSQLLAYGRLLGRMNLKTHFVIVWDCDASGHAANLEKELPDEAKVTPFAFKRRTGNTITSKGIENNFNDELLLPYTFKKVDNNGEVLGRELKKGAKAEFSKYILEHGTAEHFVHFQDLENLVYEILG